LETWVLRRAHAVTCICEGLRADIVERGIDAERVTVIPNAVDPERFASGMPRRDDLAESLGIGPGPVIGFIGSFYQYEGLDLLLEALPALRASNPRVQLLLVGGGPQEDALREQSRGLGLPADAVVFTGRVPHDEIMDYYGLIDVLAYPRRSMRLTELVTPLKPLEAMALGRVVVASDIGGHRELIRDAETGRLFTPGDSAALASALNELATSASERQRISAMARDFVLSERSWEASVARYAKPYGSVLGGGAAAMSRVPGLSGQP
ncbi:MAG: glycosyltransferase, partial [Spiribacter salinus]